MKQPAELLTLKRSLAVLTAFSERETHLGITELSLRLGLHKSQVHRIVTTLAADGFITADPRTRTYRLGPALIGLGRLAASNGGAEAAYREVLGDLAARTSETAIFNRAVRQGYVVESAVEGPTDMRYRPLIGRTYPWYGGASGHAIYAFRDHADLAADVAAGFVPEYSADAHSEADFLALYDSVRSRGYAESRGEIDGRIMSVAAPVRADGEVIGSICVIGIPEFLLRRRDELVEDVKAAAERYTAILAMHP